MAEPFLRQIKIVSFDFPPKGWALCNGQPLLDRPEPGALVAAGGTFGSDGLERFTRSGRSTTGAISDAKVDART